MKRQQTEDLKAFEQRLMECVLHIKRRTLKWKVLIAVVTLWTIASLWYWYMDDMEYDNYIDMFMGNKNLCFSLATSFLLYLLGMFEMNNASQVIMNRCRTVLYDFNMSCDEQGKLILKQSKQTHDHDSWRPS